MLTSAQLLRAVDTAEVLVLVTRGDISRMLMLEGGLRILYLVLQWISVECLRDLKSTNIMDSRASWLSPLTNLVLVFVLSHFINRLYNRMWCGDESEPVSRTEVELTIEVLVLDTGAGDCGALADRTDCTFILSKSRSNHGLEASGVTVGDVTDTGGGKDWILSASADEEQAEKNYNLSMIPKIDFRFRPLTHYDLKALKLRPKGRDPISRSRSLVSAQS